MSGKAGSEKPIVDPQTTHVVKNTLINDLTFRMPQHTSSEVTVGSYKKASKEVSRCPHFSFKEGFKSLIDNDSLILQ